MATYASGKYWTNAWNFALGCKPTGRGCLNCWAARMAAMWAAWDSRVEGVTEDGEWTGEVVRMRERLEFPGDWTRPEVVAVNWLGDLFYRAVPGWTRLEAWRSIMRWSDPEYLLLTKRPHRMALFAEARPKRVELAPHVWWGASAWDIPSFERATLYLSRIPGHTWLSVEPMLTSIPFADLSGELRKRVNNLDWVIIGSESGADARQGANPNVLERFRLTLVELGIPVWLKQWQRGRPVPAAMRDAPEPIEQILEGQM